MQCCSQNLDKKDKFKKILFPVKKYQNVPLKTLL